MANASARRNDQALAGDHDPAAILAPDFFHAAGSRQCRAGLDLDDAAATFDQRHAVEHPAHDVVLDDRRLRLGLGLRRLRLRLRLVYRPCDLVMLSDPALEALHGFADLGEPGARILVAIGAVEP